MTAARRLVLSIGLLVTAGIMRGVELVPVPPVDLGTMEPAVRQQIEGFRGLAAAPAATAGDHGTLAQLYHLYGLREQAAACYANARALAPDQLEWPYYQALLHQAAGDIDRAVVLLEEVAARAPELLPELLQPSLIRLGDLRLDADLPERARELYERALAADPVSAAAHFGAGRAAAAAGDAGDAVRYFERALELQPAASSVHYPLALAYRRLGDLERARNHLAQRGARAVVFPDPLFERLNDLSTLASFRLVRALAAKREGFSAEELFSYTLSLLSQVDGALEQLEQDLAEWPEERRASDAQERARLHYAAGVLAVPRGQDQAAGEHFRSAVALAPDLLDARIKLANVAARQGDFAAAVAQLSIVLDRESSRHDARLKRAAALSAMGRPREAARDLQRLTDAEPENPEIHWRLAVTLEQLGRGEDAIEHYLAVARLDTSIEQRALACHRAARQLRLLGQLDRARELLERALELVPGFREAEEELADLPQSRS